MFNILYVTADLIELSDYSVNNLTVNKMLYFFYGSHLVTENKPPFDTPPQAWMYGPVFSTVYHALKSSGAYKLTYLQVNRLNYNREANYNMKYLDLLRYVYNLLKDYSAQDLIRLTHRAGGSWRKTYTGIRNKIIPDDLIREEFKKFYIKKES